MTSWNLCMKNQSIAWLGVFLLVCMVSLPAYAKRDLESEFKKATEKANKDIQVALPHIEKAERMKPAPVKKAKDKNKPTRPASKTPKTLSGGSDQLVEKQLDAQAKAKAEREAAWDKVRLEQAKIARQLYTRLNTHQKKISRINEALVKEGQSTKIYPKLNVTLARCLILMGNSEDAVKLVESWNKPSGQYHDQHFETYFQSANVLLGHADQIIRDRKAERDKARRRSRGELTEEEKKAQEAEQQQTTRDASKFARQALIIFDWLAKHNDQTGAAGIDMVRAADGAGRAFMALREYQQAVYGFQFALKFNKDHLGDYQEDDPLKWLIPEIKARLAYAKKKLEEQTLGPDFVLYRDAQKLRFSKKWLPARLKYRKIINEYPDGSYAEAAEFYDMLCQIEMGDWKGAEKNLKRFYQESNYGLYRGEALLELGRINLERRASESASYKWFKLLEQWLIEAPKADAEMKQLFVMKAALKHVVPPESRHKKPDMWGNIKREKITPEMLINRHTAQWYMNHLTEQNYKFLAFLEIAKGNGDAAMTYIEKMANLSVDVANNGRANDLHRMKISARNLHIIAMPQDLKLYKGPSLLMMKLADFYYITRQWGKSLNTLSQLEQGVYGKLNSAQMDYIHLLRGMVHYRNVDRPFGDFRMKSIEAMRKAIDTKEGTYAELCAAFYMAQTIREMRPTDEDIRFKLQLERQDLLKSVMKSKNESFRNKATIELARDYADMREYEKSLELLTHLHESKGKYHQFAGRLIERIKKRAEEDQDE